MVAKVFEFLAASPYRNGVLFALASAGIIAFIYLFKPLKKGQGASVASRAINAKRHTPFVRFMELFGVLFCMVLLVALAIVFGNDLSKFACLMIAGSLIAAFSFSGLILYWVARAEK